ncbi:hypothetical protein DEJ50_00670 [Streptomyces venezuelae]|uniref:Transposase IS701-like DDE domain-containing protein n=1 Tax=Streptomyces venezuelae TaxID=54571 RepID=A0A5P2CWC4_STRVZ|nr:hypothetical protein DEJ50_00670 [Streptomyces venezuelae]
MRTFWHVWKRWTSSSPPTKRSPQPKPRWPRTWVGRAPTWTGCGRCWPGCPCLPRFDGGRLVLAVDVSPWLRSDATCSAERLFCHVHGRAKTASQFTPGWPYSFARSTTAGRPVLDRDPERGPARHGMARPSGRRDRVHRRPVAGPSTHRRGPVADRGPTYRDRQPSRRSGTSAATSPARPSYPAPSR